MVNFLAGRSMGRGGSPRRRKLLLAAAVGTCLGILCIFKYFDFFVLELTALLHAVGFQASLPLLKVILPVGISFYTFQTMSYTIDVYRGKAEPTDDFLDFALFVSLFPQLVAGPIERFTRLMPQIQSPRSRRPGDFSEGLHYVLIGLFTKMVVADNMAGLVNAVFAAQPAEVTGADCLAATYAFAFQIYGDFAGYSSIAIGVAKWLGFDLMQNFDMPYFADTPSDFWRRWHISLSSWLRDYLYIPLGGNRRGGGKTLRNLFLTMGLGGLWHGAGLTFIVWGLFHGLILCVYRLLGIDSSPKARRKRPAWRNVIAILVMFHLACLGWLFFRATSLSQAVTMLVKMSTDLHMTHLTIYVLSAIVFYCGPLMVFEGWLARKKDAMALSRTHWTARAAVYGYAAIMLWFLGSPVTYEFIYFQF